MKNEEVGDFRAPALLLAAVCGLGCALSRGQPMPDVLAPVVIPHCHTIDHHEPWLTLEGLRLIFERNVVTADE